MGRFFCPMKQHLHELRSTVFLAFPIMAGQVGQMLMGLADTAMIGRAGVLPLAACSFANILTSIFLLTGLGIMTSVSVRVSHAHGAGRSSEAGSALRAGLILAISIGLPMAILLHLLSFRLDLFGQPGAVAEESRLYLIITGWSLLPVMAGLALKNFSEAINRPWVPFWLTLAGVAFNVVLNYVFIYGWGPVPALGLTGAGIATLLARIATTAGLAWYVWRAPACRAGWAGLEKNPFHIRHLEPLWILGLPVGLQLLFEVGSFAVATMMMGWIGVTALAAHQIALTCAATTFMFPLGVAMAVTIRIGHAVGAHEFGRVRPIGSGALFLSAAIMGAAALLFFFHGPVIASWFVVDETTRRLTAALFIIAAIFQIFDGLQVVAVGALRGLADVKVPMAFMFTAYWIIALPFGYLTAFTLGWGPAGIWGGLAIGLAVVSSLLVYRFLHKSGRLPGLPGHPV